MAVGFKTGGRQKGSVNKITRSFREAVLRAFQDLGGVEALTEWAKENPGEFFKICARLIPVEISAPGGGVTVIVNRGGALLEQSPALIEQRRDAAAALPGPLADR